MTLPTAPMGVAAVPAVPHGHTAVRLEWRFLPPEVRARIEGRLGSPVVDAVTRNSGFTPGFASVVTAEDGSRAFVKAASKAAQREIAGSYAEEARKLSILGDGVPSPRLDWVDEDDAWVVLGFAAVDARQPSRPWRPTELDRALDLAEQIAEATRDVPEELALKPIVEDLPRLLTGWGDISGGWPHREEAAALAATLPALPESGRFLHSDLRDDNILFVEDGRTLACDWNWPSLGPPWLDVVVLLVAAHGDGLDVEPHLSGRALTAGVQAEHIDAWLAALTGFMISRRTRPAPPSSPYLVTHTDWYGEAAWSWLAQRRGWS